MNQFAWNRPALVALTLMLSWCYSVTLGIAGTIICVVAWRKSCHAGFERRALLGMTIGLCLGLSQGPSSANEPIYGDAILFGMHSVEGRVVSLPRVTEHGWVMRVQLSLPTSGDVLMHGSGSLPAIAAGARVRWTSRFRFSSGLSSSRGPVAFTKSPDHLEILEVPSWMSHISGHWRSWLSSRIREALPPRLAAWVFALGLGESALLGRPLKDRVRSLGLSHLLAVSGLHFSFLFGWIWIGTRRIRQNTNSAMLRWLITLTTVGLLMVYFMITRQGPATLRALIFVVLYLLSLLLQHDIDVVSVICFALIGIALQRPDMLSEPGAQLSFCGVVSLLINQWRWRHRERFAFRTGPKSLGRRAWEWSTFLLAPWLGTLGLTSFWFGGISAFALLANGIGIPVVAFFLLPLTLLTVLALVFFGGISALLTGKTETLIQLIESGLVRLDDMFGLWLPMHVEITTAFMITVSSFLVLSWCSGRIRLVSTGVLCLSVFSAWFFRGPSVPQAVFLNVGHGDSVMVCDDRDALLVDGGKPGAGWHNVLNLVRRRDCGKRLHVMVSHGDMDHAGGLFPVLERERVATLLIAKVSLIDPLVRDLVTLAIIRGVNVEELVAGDTVFLNKGFQLDVLWPQDISEPPQESGNRNNRSLVVLGRLGDRSILLTGDVEMESERSIIQRPLYASLDILKVAHHGSHSSTSEDFIRWAQPSFAVISNDRNRHHPHPTVLNRLSQKHIGVWMTSNGGTVSFYFDPSGVVVTRFPDNNR